MFFFSFCSIEIARLILFLSEYTCLEIEFERMWQRQLQGLTRFPDNVTSRAGVIYPFAGTDRGRESPPGEGECFNLRSQTNPFLCRLEEVACDLSNAPTVNTISLPCKRLLDPTLSPTSRLLREATTCYSDSVICIYSSNKHVSQWRHYCGLREIPLRTARVSLWAPSVTNSYVGLC